MGKTKGKKFDNIKEQIQPLTDIWKDIFCEFDKNEIHKEITFIFQLRSPNGTHGDFYIIDEKDLIHDYNYDDESMEVMYLWDSKNKKNEEDERKINITGKF